MTDLGDVSWAVVFALLFVDFWLLVYRALEGLL
jgi:hypothetical protein